ncbi:hypothetical protein AB0D63_20745 [Kitasatospora sp. NPDC048343]
MIEPEVLGFEAFLDLLNDPEFDAQELSEFEEFFEVDMRGLEEWMLP